MRVKLESLCQCLHHAQRVNHNQNMSADCLNNFKDVFQLCPFRIQLYSKSIFFGGGGAYCVEGSGLDPAENTRTGVPPTGQGMKHENTWW